MIGLRLRAPKPEPVGGRKKWPRVVWLPRRASERAGATFCRRRRHGGRALISRRAGRRCFNLGADVARFWLHLCRLTSQARSQTNARLKIKPLKWRRPFNRSSCATAACWAQVAGPASGQFDGRARRAHPSGRDADRRRARARLGLLLCPTTAPARSQTSLAMRGQDTPNEREASLFRFLFPPFARPPARSPEMRSAARSKRPNLSPFFASLARGQFACELGQARGRFVFLGRASRTLELIQNSATLHARARPRQATRREQASEQKGAATRRQKGQAAGSAIGTSSAAPTCGRSCAAADNCVPAGGEDKQAGRQAGGRRAQSKDKNNNTEQRPRTKLNSCGPLLPCQEFRLRAASRSRQSALAAERISSAQTSGEAPKLRPNFVFASRRPPEVARR